MENTDISKLLQDLSIKPIYNTSTSVNVRLKPNLLSEVDNLVNEAGCTRSRFIKTAIEFYLRTIKNNRKKQDEF